MAMVKRGVQAFVMAAGALILSSCYAVVEDRHYYRSKPGFHHHQHQNHYRSYHHRPYYDRHQGNGGHRHWRRR